MTPSTRKLLAAQWIPVDERLPEIDQIVLVSWPSHFDQAQVIAFGARLYEDEGWLWGISQSLSGLILSRTLSWNDIEADDDYPVTHWQPIVPPDA